MHNLTVCRGLPVHIRIVSELTVTSALKLKLVRIAQSLLQTTADIGNFFLLSNYLTLLYCTTGVVVVLFIVPTSMSSEDVRLKSKSLKDYCETSIHTNNMCSICLYRFIFKYIYSNVNLAYRRCV